MGRTVFNMQWCAKYNWVQAFKGDRHKALCNICHKTFDLSKMGESAVKSHARSRAHRSHEKARGSVTLLSMPFYCNSKEPQPGQSDKADMHETLSIPPPKPDVVHETLSIPLPKPECSARLPAKVPKYFADNPVLTAEVLWTLKTIVNHSSYRSNDNIDKVFQRMFPDSEIAKKFSCASKKTAYLCVFGVAQHFSDLLLETVRGPYTILFDESLNKKSHEKQMDIHVRFLDSNTVVTRYFGSTFLGHATASDMLQHFTTAVLESKLDIKMMIQVGMDGPNVNCAFYDKLRKKLLDDYGFSLLNIGSCGLHIVHNAFRAGATSTGWNISEFLKSVYYLFKDSPARKEDFLSITHGSQLPLKFVSHRWLENIPVCNRALDILESIMRYIKAVQEKKVSKPGCKSYQTVCEVSADKLVKAKLHFFKCVAAQLQPFLMAYQCEKPMVCFMAHDLNIMLRNLFRCFIKEDKLSQAKSANDMMSLIDNKENFLTYKKVDIGYQAEKELKDVVKNENLSGRQVMDFRMQFVEFLTNTVKKILSKCPLSYALVRNMSALNPKEMATNPEQCRMKFKKVLTYLATCGRIKGDDCDKVQNQYSTFLENIPVLGTQKFSGFNHKSDSCRVDELLLSCMADDEYSGLREVIKLLLVISHGQAAVERGFSVNKEVEIENLKQNSLVAQRVICDHVQSVGGLLNVPIDKSLLLKASMSRNKYERYLEDQRKEKKTEQEQRKRKHILEELSSIKEKKKRMSEDVASLKKSADSSAEKAESTGRMTFVSQSNAMRRAAKEKEVQLIELEKKHDAKIAELK